MQGSGNAGKWQMRPVVRALLLTVGILAVLMFALIGVLSVTRVTPAGVARATLRPPTTLA